MGAPHLVPSLDDIEGVPELHVHPVLMRLKLQHGHRKRPNSYDSCGWKLCKEVLTTPSPIRKFPRSEVVSSMTRKVFLTQSIEVNPQLFPCKMRDRRWRVLS